MYGLIINDLLHDQYVNGNEPECIDLRTEYPPVPDECHSCGSYMDEGEFVDDDWFCIGCVKEAKNAFESERRN